MKILGIETSCDDTSMGIIKYENNYIEVIANEIYTHESKLGVIPELMSRNHLEQLPIVFEKIKDHMETIDYIAVTCCPGLIGGLVVGYNYALGLSYRYKKKIIPCHHIEGHIYSILTKNISIKYPFLACIISGGHSLIVYVTENNYEILSTTIDDSMGEIIDKIGRKLGLNFPAGPELEKMALKVNKDIINMEIPYKESLNFSFSGLKTKFLNLIEKNIYTNEEIAHALQSVLAKTLIYKLKKIKKENMENIYLIGGVASNNYIRNELLKEFNNLIIPDRQYCTDNGVMIACAALQNILNKNLNVNNYNIEEKSNLSLLDWKKLINV